MIKLRPHHSLCMQFFIGNGYSPMFTENMYATLALPRDTKIEITYGLDHLCQACPNHPGEICTSEIHVAEIDKKVSLANHFHARQRLTMDEFFKASKNNIILKGKLHDVCGNCNFMNICEIEAKRIISSEDANK